MAADKRNKEYYDKRHRKAQVHLEKDDYVVVKIPKLTKLGPKAKGPFKFLRYMSKDKLTAMLIDPTRVE